MEIERLKMPGHAPREVLTYPGSIVTLAATREVEAFPHTFVKTTLIQLSNYLIGVVTQPTLFGRPAHDPHRPSLRTLHDRLHIGRLAPSPVAKDNTSIEYVKKSLGQIVNIRIQDRELQDFEDLCYALIARMQEMRQTLNAWLASSFISADGKLFEGGPTITVFHSTLCTYWTILQEPAFVRAIDEAVRASRLECTSEQIKALVESGEVGIEDAAPCLQGLYDSWDKLIGVNFKMLGWSPAMIAAYLEDRYRLVLGLEKDVEEKRVREVRKRAKLRKSVEDLKSRRTIKRTSGDSISSERRLSKEAKRSPVIRSGPAKAVRFVVDPKARGEVRKVGGTASSSIDNDDDTRFISWAHNFVLRGSLPKHDSVQSMMDLDDFTALREQRALQTNLHIDIERQLHLEVASSSRGTTASEPVTSRQYSFCKIDDASSWEHMLNEYHKRNTNATEHWAGSQEPWTRL